MQYMLLLYADPAAEPAPGTRAHDAMMQDYFTLSARLTAEGVMRGGEGLAGVEAATTVRMRVARVETMDGPFAETKEHLGGFYLIDVPDLDAALKIAGQVPAARYGLVEVRPVMTFEA